VASEDTERPHATAERFTLDDFRLRLDSPLFHRDPGANASPVARELPWERPAADRAGGVSVVSPQPPTPALPAQPTAGVPTRAPAPRLRTFAELVAEAEEPAAGPTEAEEPAAGPAVADERAAGPGVTVAAAVSTQPDVAADDAVRLDLSLPDNGDGGVDQPASEAEEEALVVLRNEPAVVVPAIDPELIELATQLSRSLTTVESRNSDSVQAELDRLAFVPDSEAPAAPVEIPPIVVAEPPPERMAEPQADAPDTREPATALIAEVSRTALPVARVAVHADDVPSLSQHEMYMPKVAVQQRPRMSYSDFAAQLAPARRRARHPLRKLFGTLVLLAMVGGGLFAAKYYFLDQRWDADVKPMAAEVETVRGLQFDHAVAVSEVEGTEYAEKLVRATVGFAADDPQVELSGWRALGLLNGKADLATLGLAGIGDAPAFYDPGSETIYVVRDLPADLRRFALQRALALALLDQEYGWGGRAADQSPAVQRGMRALYDADALAVASALLDDTERANVLLQQSALYTVYPAAGSSSSFATAVATRSGLALRGYFDSASIATRDAVQRDAQVTDGAVLDMRRLLAATPATAVAKESQGMLFWYHALAARVGNDTAWRAALAWQADTVSFVGDAKVCVTGLVQVDPAAHDFVYGVFSAWAAAAPAESSTQVGAPAAGQISVTACDPGELVASNDGRARLSLGGAPLRSEQFRQLAAAYPQLAPTQLACAVYGTDDVSPADERAVVDPVGGWTAPANHPPPDPNGGGCSG
jgi:hypothetical protein